MKSTTVFHICGWMQILSGMSLLRIFSLRPQQPINRLLSECTHWLWNYVYGVEVNAIKLQWMLLCACSAWSVANDTFFITIASYAEQWIIDIMVIASVKRATVADSTQCVCGQKCRSSCAQPSETIYNEIDLYTYFHMKKKSYLCHILDGYFHILVSKPCFYIHITIVQL